MKLIDPYFDKTRDWLHCFLKTILCNIEIRKSKLLSVQRSQFIVPNPGRSGTNILWKILIEVILVLCFFSKNCVEALLEHGAKIDIQTGAGKENMTALGYACQKGHYEVLKVLLERGAAPDKKSNENFI